jgi:carbamoyl-phosphate synthase large subunit
MSAGSGPSNNLMRSLLRHDPTTVLIGCNSDRFALKQSPATQNFLIPFPDPDNHSTDAFEKSLQSIVECTGVDLVIPGNDRDALVLAQLNDRAALACRSFLPAAKTLALCQDKYALNVTLSSGGIPVPPTYPVFDRTSLFEAWQAIGPRELAWCRIRRGAASRGATMVRDADQAWNWISYWHTMRGVPIEDFTLSEFLPGRDYNVQGVWHNGCLVLLKMCERLSYLGADQQPSGMASTPALAKTVWVPTAIDACKAAINVIDRSPHGIFNFDLKESEEGIPCITEINAGRFAMITNLYDLTGRSNMAAIFMRLGCGEHVNIENPHDDAGEFYLVRDLDNVPSVFHADEFFEGIDEV